MNSRQLENAYTFILNNARLLERRRFAYLFGGGPREPVLAALRAYQNPDGGFGNALEPDKRTPTSQPIDQEIALQVVDEIGFEPVIGHQICDFLTTITSPAGGVPFVLPTVRDAPRAPWWNTDDNPPPSLNPTASIAGLLHRGRFNHPWLERASAYCWDAIDGLTSAGSDVETHDLLAIVIFLENVPARARALITFEKLKLQILAHTALDPHAEGYVHKPLAWAPEPASLCRPLFDHQTIIAHLEALADAQQPDGGWPISWMAVSPGTELEYRAVNTIDALKTLKAYQGL